MKKFFALFLSLMMLFAVSAVAETIDMSAPHLRGWRGLC